jgi:hypothetical protein
VDKLLDEATWHARRSAHEARVDCWVGPYLRRRERGIEHPVDDFLFTYYSYRPASLKRWHPGIGAVLCGPSTRDFAGVTGYVVSDDGARLDLPLVAGRLRAARGIGRLLRATAQRAPQLGCFGLHEWAMVYRQPPSAVRHATYPLRLGGPGSDEVVETHRITCTHYDAFRFFTDAARPRNVVQPSRDTQASLEQPGCLHATMDLYKWAYKLAPATASELVADCFELAYEVRQVDMRAAPYDLSALGIAPLRIETAAGKAEYLNAQQRFAQRGAALRASLVEACDEVSVALAGRDSRGRGLDAAQPVGDGVKQRRP